MKCARKQHNEMNGVVLNPITDGVSCEIDSNRSINVRFLEGKHSDLGPRSQCKKRPLSVIGGIIPGNNRKICV